MTKKVIVYSTSTCGFCQRLKAFLNEHKIAFTNHDVGEDQKAAQEMIAKSKQMGVPVTDIDGEIIVGFDEDALRKKLGL